jgi:DNA-binding SARP family transcriptional activator/tetratricopeptide (TPR) repeat protein
MNDGLDIEVGTAGPAPWRLRLAGAPALLAPDGRVLPLEGLAAIVAARLALAGPQPRELLARQLWPDADEGRARGNLRQRLLRLKAQAGWAWIEGGTHLRLHPLVQLDADAGGMLLDGLPQPADESLADWLAAQRQTLARGHMHALQQQLAQAEAAQQWDEALTLAERMVAMEPSAEASHRTLARLHYLNHDHGRARDALERLRLMLLRDHGAAPSRASEELRALIERASVPLGQAALPADGALPTLQSLSPALSPALLRPPRLVGREPELARMQQALAECGALLLLGEAGLGKSRLLAEAAAACGDVLGVKAQAGDAGVPYATLSRLLRKQLAWRGVPATPPAVGQLLVRLLPEMGVDAASGAVPLEASRPLLQQAVQTLLAHGLQRVVVVDDLHFADAASLEMLAGLVNAGPLAHLAWLFAQRPGEGGSAALAFGDSLIESGRLQTLRLQPLDEPAVARLLLSLALPGLDAPAWAWRLHRHTGGNPMFILETLKQLQSGDLAAGRLPRSATVGALIDRRLKALSPDALALARLAAIAGADFSLPLAEEVTGRSALHLADAWAELEAAQVLRDRAFAHDLVLEAALRGIPQPIAEHLHGAVARHLQAHGGEAARLAAHWLAARDEAAALPHLLNAADVARDAMRRREQLGFIEKAAEIAARHPQPGPQGAHMLYLRTFAAREVVDGVTEALPALDLALQYAQTDVERVNVLSLRACARTRLYELDSAVEDYQAALPLALRTGDDKVTADIMGTLATALSMLDRHDEAAALMARHWPVVERMPDPEPALYTERGLVCDNAGRPYEGREFHRRAIEIARQRGEHSEVLVATRNLATSFVDTGELDAAAALLAQADALLQAHEGLDSAHVTGWSLQAIVCREQGHFGQALAASGHALADNAEQVPVRAPLDRQHRAWTWFWLGQWARAMQDLPGNDVYPDLPAWVAARGLQLRARLAAARGLPVGDALARARAMLEPGTLRTMRESIMLDAALAMPDAAAGLAQALAVRDAALADGYHGLRWAAEWACARLALAAGMRPQAMTFGAACMERPDAHMPQDLAMGRWWHGLWRLWLALGDSGRAEAARAEGVAWIHRTLQRELASEFHPSFREAVVAHRELLAGTTGSAPGGALH